MNHHISGLVLAGGKSMRMGSDKAFIHYADKPQYKTVFELLKCYCNEVYVSVNKHQKVDLPFITDNSMIKISGPALGIASAFEFKRTNWLVLAIDYPLVSGNEINHLLKHRNEQANASVYVNESGFFEPGIGIYECSFYPVLIHEINYGSASLQQALVSANAAKIHAQDAGKLLNVNTPEDHFRAKLKTK